MVRVVRAEEAVGLPLSPLVLPSHVRTAGIRCPCVALASYQHPGGAVEAILQEKEGRMLVGYLVGFCHSCVRERRGWSKDVLLWVL